ncbi:MAG: tRNA epoxyqueuosine(34) reductase QueG [Bdellovibrionales bacterium]|nr:tRNA epoxyqueuosine(34) reductase QueG [Bdellovibrionales bacterium]
MSTMPEDLRSLIDSFGFDHWGLVELKIPLSLSIYQNWINEGRHADMEYLSRHLEQKKDPTNWLPQMRSAIVIGLSYIPHPRPSNATKTLSALKIARYARGEDYHQFFQSRLENLCLKLQEKYSGEVFQAFSDSAPLMDRDLAYQAGLGWFGKNSCLIDRKKGSFFLIGEILTSLQLSTIKAPAADFCGTCNRCVEACPTDAILANRTLAADRCISYLNIESRGIPSKALRQSMGNWLFGCDICQEVCPWNQKILRTEKDSSEPHRSEVIEALRFLLTTSNSQLEKHFSATPLLRRRSFGLKRSALIVAENLIAHELTKEIIDLQQNNPRLAGLAAEILESFNKFSKDTQDG